LERLNQAAPGRPCHCFLLQSYSVGGLWASTWHSAHARALTADHAGVGCPGVPARLRTLPIKANSDVSWVAERTRGVPMFAVK
jgi:hypothetical protein